MQCFQVSLETYALWLYIKDVVSLIGVSDSVLASCASSVDANSHPLQYVNSAASSAERCHVCTCVWPSTEHLSVNIIAVTL